MQIMMASSSNKPTDDSKNWVSHEWWNLLSNRSKSLTTTTTDGRQNAAPVKVCGSTWDHVWFCQAGVSLCVFVGYRYAVVFRYLMVLTIDWNSSHRYNRMCCYEYEYTYYTWSEIL